MSVFGDRETSREDHAPPVGTERTYLSSGGAAIVAAVFVVFVAFLLAYFTSAMSWAPW